MRPVSVFFVGVTLEGVKLDALNWFFNSLFCSWFFYISFVYGVAMPMSIVSFIVQLDTGTFCVGNVFL